MNIFRVNSFKGYIILGIGFNFFFFKKYEDMSLYGSFYVFLYCE